MPSTQRLSLFTLFGLLLLSACSREPVSAPSVTENTATAVATVSAATSDAFRRYLGESYAQDMARAPFTASYRGVKTHNDQWNSVAESHLEESRLILDKRLSELEAYPRSSLDESLQLSRDIYQLDIERRIALDDYRHEAYIIHQYRGPHTLAPSNLINIHTIANVAEAEDYIGRLRNIGPWFDQVIEQLQIRQSKNLFLVDWQYPQMITAAGNVITGVPYDTTGDDSTLWADFQAKLAPLDISDEQRKLLLADARSALVDVVKPAYQRLIAELEKQGEMAPDVDGVWRFERGEAFYAQLLRWYTTTTLGADEIHNIGLREVERIHAEMAAVMQQVEYGGDLAEFFVFMRNDPQFYYPNTDAGRAAYLEEANGLIDAMRARLPEQFGVLPQAPLVVKRVEPFREQSAGKAFYQGPPPDGSRPGIYYANLYNMADMPKYQMAALAYHEGVPGHHLQLAISAELQGVPEFQKFTRFTAFSEGWGLYSELLPKEMGFYPDPYANFGRLAMELWRAARLVVDTGIHSKRWTREQAIDYLVKNTPNSLGDCTRAIERYIAMPGQATAYMIGKLKILELRERARSALGEDFDIRDFHDLVLKDGPIPLSLLERKVDQLIGAAPRD